MIDEVRLAEDMRPLQVTQFSQRLAGSALRAGQAVFVEEGLLVVHGALSSAGLGACRT
ncbi:hypothetical protein D3C85_1783460 [compost metagenome]